MPDYEMGGSPWEASQSSGVQAIAKERGRQVNSKGHHPNGDVGRAAELAQAAHCYTDKALSDLNDYAIDNPPWDWPWDSSAWSPEPTPLENLTKAGALIAAAIDAINADEALDLDA